VLVTDHAVVSARPFMDVLSKLVEQGSSLLILATDFQGDAIPTFVQNTQKGTLKSQLVKGPGFGAQQAEHMKDVCALTGATFISREVGLGLRDVTIEHLGRARRVRVTAKDTVFTDGGGNPDDVEARIAQIKGEVARSGSEYDKDKLQERLGRLMGGICVIKVGAATELSMKEIKARMEDALFATQASISEGVVPGGGLTLLRAADRVRELVAASGDQELDMESPIGELQAAHTLPTDLFEQAGFDLVLRACEEPLMRLVENAGGRGGTWVDRVRAASSTDELSGVDVTDFKIKNMLEAGIIDPLKVVRSALQNAVSVAGTMLTTEVAIHKGRPATASEALTS